MNVVNKFFLYLLLLPHTFYSRLGINISHLRAILTAKLIMDDRRPNTFQQTNKKKDKPVSSATIGTMVLSAVLGTFFLGSFTVGTNDVTHLSLYFSMYIFMLAATLISDFTSVLVDVRDNFIILPKPVSDRTLVTARLLHITIHLAKLVLPMSLPGVIYLWLTANAWKGFSLFIMILFVTLFTIFLINALYIIILRITTPQKFQSIINYFQVFFAVFIFAGYQLVPRLLSNDTLAGYDVAKYKLMWLLPPYWFAGGWQLLANGDVQLSWVIALFLSVFIPIASIVIVVRFLAPSFNQKLAMIAGNAESTSTIEKKHTPRVENNYATSLANVVTQRGEERMGFLLSWKMTARSKDFRMKVYPSFGYLLVYFVILLVNGKSLSLDAIRQQTKEGQVLLLSIIYFSSFMLIVAISQVAYSEKYKAAWLYFTTPVKAPGALITGALKAVVLKFYLPIIALVSIPAFIIVGPAILPNLVFGLCNEILICTLVAYFTLHHLPFSENQNTASKSGSFIKGIFMMLVPAIIGLLHYVLYSRYLVVSIAAIVSLGLALLILRSIQKLSWARVKTVYEE